MDAKSFKDEILEHYTDQEFQITIDRNPTRWSSGNGILFSSIFYTVLHLNNLISEDDKVRFSRMVDLCWVDPYIGILERNDQRKDKEAHDDYHVATASYLLRTYHAEAIYNYGDMHNWSFNNENPGKWTFSTWHGRFPGTVGYYSIAARKEPGWLDLWMLKKTMRSSLPERSDGMFMRWLKAQVMLKSDKEDIRSAGNDFIGKAKGKWGSLGKILEPYFGSDHPFSKIPTIEGIF